MKIEAGVAEKKNTIIGRTLYETAVAVEGLPPARRPQIQIGSNAFNFEFFFCIDSSFGRQLCLSFQL